MREQNSETVSIANSSYSEHIQSKSISLLYQGTVRYSSYDPYDPYAWLIRIVLIPRYISYKT